MSIAVQLYEDQGDAPTVRYRWDPDTDILTALLGGNTAPAAGLSGSVELAGTDGSWIMLDVRNGAITGVEVAVWPEVRTVAALAPPPVVHDARVVLPSGPENRSGLTLVQVETTIIGEADGSERTIHFCLGEHEPARTVRLATDLLVELDHASAITGFWLLNVPALSDRA